MEYTQGKKLNKGIRMITLPVFPAKTSVRVYAFMQANPSEGWVSYIIYEKF